MSARPVGYRGGMVFHPEDDRPIDVEGVPEEEDVDTADAADRVDLDPEEQENRDDPEERERQTED